MSSVIILSNNNNDNYNINNSDNIVSILCDFV